MSIRGRCRCCHRGWLHCKEAELHCYVLGCVVRRLEVDLPLAEHVVALLSMRRLEKEEAGGCALLTMNSHVDPYVERYGSLFPAYLVASAYAESALHREATNTWKPVVICRLVLLATTSVIINPPTLQHNNDLPKANNICLFHHCCNKHSSTRLGPK